MSEGGSLEVCSTPVEWSEKARLFVGHEFRLDSVGASGAVGKVYSFNAEDQTFTIDTMVMLIPNTTDLITVSETDIFDMLAQEKSIVGLYSPIQRAVHHPIKEDASFAGRLQRAFPQPLARPTASRIPLAPLKDGHSSTISWFGIGGQSHSAATLGRLATLRAWKEEASQYIRRCNMIALATNEGLKALEQTSLEKLRLLCGKYQLSSKGTKSVIVERLSGPDIGGRAYQDYLLQAHSQICSIALLQAAPRN